MRDTRLVGEGLKKTGDFCDLMRDGGLSRKTREPIEPGARRSAIVRKEVGP